MDAEEVPLEFTTIATLQEDGSVCCQNCGSWCHVDDLLRNGRCPLCGDRIEFPTQVDPDEGGSNARQG